MIFCIDHKSTSFLTDVQSMYIAMIDYRRQHYAGFALTIEHYCSVSVKKLRKHSSVSTWFYTDVLSSLSTPNLIKPHLEKPYTENPYMDYPYMVGSHILSQLNSF